MKRTLACVLLLSCSIVAQQLDSRPAFEVASISVAAPVSMKQSQGSMTSDAAMLRYTNVSLKDCIRVAYRVKDFQVDGPDWLGDARFDIAAKLPAGSSQEQVPDMLQSLLADRFRLATHRISREHPTYALVVGRTDPKLTPAIEAQTGTAGKSAAPASMTKMQNASGLRLRMHAATLSSFAEFLYLRSDHRC